MDKATDADAPGAPPESMRVLMVVRLFHPWVGGMERQVHKLALALRARDIDVKIVTGWWFRGTPRRESIGGIPVFRNFTLWECFGIKGLRKLGGYLYIASLMAYILRHGSEFDVIHIHGLSYHAFAAVVAGHWRGRPIVVKLANSGPASDIAKMRSSQHLALCRLMLPAALSADCFIALNKLIVNELAEAGVPRARIQEIPNGVPVEGVAPKSDYTLQRPARLLFVGRLHPQKGLDMLLRALRRICDECGNGTCRLTLLGDGPQKSELEALAASLGISAQVEFAGESTQVQDYYRKADIFVLPSKAEGISNSLLEAMSQGLPSAVSDIPGNADVVDDKVNGVLFKPDDEASLAARIRELLENEGLRERIGKAARREIESRFGIGRIAEQYGRLYQTLVSGTGNLKAGKGSFGRRFVYPN